MKVFTKMFWVPLVAALVLLVGAPATNAAGISYEATPSPVIDSADILSPTEESELTEIIQSYQQEYGLSFVVESIPSLNGQNLEEFALQRANELGVGNAELDNGVFILVSRDDRKVRFELGAGVTQEITDSETEQIISTVVTPNFKTGEYFGGLVEGMEAVGAEYNGDVIPVPVSSEKLYDPVEVVGAILVITVALIALIVGGVFLVKSLKRRKKQKAAQRREELLGKVRGFASSLSNAELKEYKVLPNQQARYAWIKSHYSAVTDAIEELNDSSAQIALADRGLLPSVLNIPYRMVFAAQANDADVRKFAQQKSDAFHNVSLDEAEQRISKAKAIHEKKMAKRVKAENNARAKRVEARATWKKIPSNVKRELKKARTKAERENLLVGTPYASDFMLHYPILASMYFTASSSGSSSSSSSSSYSSGSSSSYYSGGYDGGSSYSGGSFDGGGGSGSW